MELFTEKILSLKELIGNDDKRCVILSHTNPDGDAVGSSLAWADMLCKMGCSCNCIIPNRYPDFLDWMPGVRNLIVAKEDMERAVEAIRGADLIFCVDFNSIERLEALTDAIRENTEAKRILIDHHLNPPEEYDLMFSYPQWCSTAYVVYNIIVALGGEDAIDKACAENIYVGIMTDTGNFSFSFLTPELFRAVAVLIEKGVSIPAVNAAVYSSFTEGRVRLLGFSLCNKMSLIENGSAAYISLTEAEMRRFNFQLGDSEGFVNYPLTIKGVKMSAIFIATHKFIRVSLRSRGDDVDVNIFARRYFNGGGHKNAAGGKSFVSMAETVDYFKKSVAEFFAEK